MNKPLDDSLAPSLEDNVKNKAKDTKEYVKDKAYDAKVSKFAYTMCFCLF